MAEEQTYYCKYKFETKQVDTLVAMLNELPFNGFEMVDDCTVHGYISQEDNTPDFDEQLAVIKTHIPFEMKMEKVALQNWNATWEKDFKAVIVDDFCVVRADFHDPYPDIIHEIIITPQMSFGTGHHETTRGMIQTMRDMDFVGKKVLDFGCGTGVLSILAEKLGAKAVLGVDIDNNAYMNSIHNCAQNNCNMIQIEQGDLSETASEYDIILANINRHVILNTLPSLSDKLSIGSPLLLSGILFSDIALLEKHLMKHSFKIVNTLRLNDWMCLLTDKV